MSDLKLYGKYKVALDAAVEIEKLVMAATGKRLNLDERVAIAVVVQRAIEDSVPTD